MLTAHVERYVALRQALGFNLRDVARDLRAYARYAEARGDACVRLQTAADWAEQVPSPRARHVRLRRVADLARFLHAEDPAHEVPPAAALHVPARRPLPHIYTPEQLARIVAAAGLLRETYTLRRRTYATLFGLIAATGLRISEALGLRLGDLLPGGVLRIERTKFGKSRFVPLHPTAKEALGRYLDAPRQLGEADDHVFLSAGRRRIGLSMADYTFRRVLRLAGIVSGRERACRVHDLRHTFATRALERCSMQGQAVARHFVALATYTGHTDIAHTYWYLEATPELMADVAAAGEACWRRRESAHRRRCWAEGVAVVLGRRAGAAVLSSSVCGEGGAVLVAVQDASRRARARCPSGILDRPCARRLGRAQVGTTGWPP